MIEFFFFNIQQQTENTISETNNCRSYKHLDRPTVVPYAKTSPLRQSYTYIVEGEVPLLKLLLYYDFHLMERGTPAAKVDMTRYVQFIKRFLSLYYLHTIYAFIQQLVNSSIYTSRIYIYLVYPSINRRSTFIFKMSKTRKCEVQ